MYFFPSSVLKWLHKNTPILIRFFKSMLIQQLSRYNLNKIVLNEVRQLSATRAIVWGENELFGQPSTYEEGVSCQIPGLVAATRSEPLKDLCYWAFPTLSGDSRNTLCPWNCEVHFQIFCNHAVWHPQMNGQSVD